MATKPETEKQIGVMITPSGSAPDRFVPCLSWDLANNLLYDIREARTQFIQRGDLLIGIASIAYAEIVEQ